jgi:hypothetical protein
MQGCGLTTRILQDVIIQNLKDKKSVEERKLLDGLNEQQAEMFQKRFYMNEEFDSIAKSLHASDIKVRSEYIEALRKIKCNFRQSCSIKGEKFPAEVNDKIDSQGPDSRLPFKRFPKMGGR